MKMLSPYLKAISFAILIAILSSCQSQREKLAEEISAGEQKLFSDTTKMLNMEIANAVLHNYIKYADENKGDTSSAAYLFKAGDLANGLNKPDEAIRLYQRLRDEYPQYRKAAASLFMQAFIFETSIRDKEKAKEKYIEFISAHPDHPLTPSAQASLDQLNANLTDEEMIRMFEQSAAQ